MKGTAIVISAPSGAGKSTLCKMLREEFPDFGYSVSCTTRPMRPGETEGRDYFFISGQDFKKMRQSGGFAETAVVHGHHYGTPLAPVKTMLDAGQDLLFDVDVQGAAQLKASLPGAVFVFVLPPAMAELERRLRNRGSEADTDIRLRLANAAAEIREAFWYDAIIVNDDLQSAYAGLRAVYLAAKLAPGRNLHKLEELLDECGAING
ncbi:MAG: guanylate kinase [Desulfovibrio sp.]|nr:guanylate kinase [Desulfovibrio sp.]